MKVVEERPLGQICREEKIIYTGFTHVVEVQQTRDQIGILLYPISYLAIVKPIITIDILIDYLSG
jgi:hypothetical protein